MSVKTLATSELDELKSQLERVSQRLEELENSDAPNDWANRIQLKGDLRYRYEYKAMDQKTDKHHSRIRARIGAYGDVNDQVKVGIGLATGSSNDPTSTNQTLGDEASQKAIWLDRAYFTYSPAEVDGLSLTLGKMTQPWVQISDLIFDTDVNPEGFAAAYDFELGELRMQSRAGVHVMEENTNDDVTLLSGQLAASTDLANDVELSAGLGGFVYEGISGTGYDLIDSFLQVDLRKGPAPVKLFGEYLLNVADEADENRAWLVGIGSKYKKLGLEYNYRDMGAESVLANLADSDFGGPGGKGHKLKTKLKVLKNMSADLTYYRVENRAGQDVDLIQANVVVKF